MRGKERDSTTNETSKVMKNQWGNTGMLASTNEGFFQFQARPGNKGRNMNPQVKGGVTSEGEFGSRHVKTVLMDMNKDIFTLAQPKGKWKWLALAKQQQDTMEAEIEGPMQKRKLKIDGVLKETNVVKRQKIKEERKVLGKLMPQHLGWVVVVVQHHRVQ